MSFNEELLEKSIISDDKVMELYSMTSMFYVAFFGGPIAIALYSLLNSKQFNKLKIDLLISVSFILANIFLVFYALNLASDVELTDVVKQNIRHFRYALKIFGLLFLGIYYLRYKKFHRAHEFQSNIYKSPWIPAIACTAINFIVFYSVYAVGGNFAK